MHTDELSVFLKVLKVRKDREVMLAKVYQGMMATKASEVRYFSVFWYFRVFSHLVDLEGLFWKMEFSPLA